MDEFDDKDLPGPAITCAIAASFIIFAALVVAGFIWLLSQFGH